MRCLLIFIVLLCGTASVAQNRSFRKGSIGATGYFGSFLTNLPKADYVRDSWSSFTELFWERQTDGSRDWHLANKLPQIGTAIFYGNTGSRQYMGHMAGLFSYAHLTLLRTPRFKSRFRIGGGLAWVEKPYDLTTNHKGVLIGSYINAYIQFMLLQELRISSKLFLHAGLNFSHLSNGSTMLPNLGLNIPSLAFGIRYGADQPPFHHSRLPLEKQWGFSLYTAAGLKQFPWIRSERYAVNLLQAEAMKKFAYADGFGAGAAIFYDRSLQVDPSGIPSLKREGNRLQAGLYLAYEHDFGRLSMPLQLGTYVYNRDINSALFQQIGLRYHLNRQWRLQFLMKTHSGKADFLHLGAGYRFGR